VQTGVLKIDFFSSEFVKTQTPFGEHHIFFSFPSNRSSKREQTFPRRVIFHPTFQPNSLFFGWFVRTSGRGTGTSRGWEKSLGMFLFCAILYWPMDANVRTCLDQVDRVYRLGGNTNYALPHCVELIQQHWKELRRMNCTNCKWYFGRWLKDRRTRMWPTRLVN